MPKGTYEHRDPHGGIAGTEVFSCAPGPAGWRYVSQCYDPDGTPAGRVDLTVDAGWRQVRVAVTRGGWVLRGGVVGAEAFWVRAPDGPGPPGGGPEPDRSERAAGFTGRSPAFLVATARLLRLGLLDRRRVRLLAVTEPACLPLPADEGWALVDRTPYEAETGTLLVERYEVADLLTAERRIVHLAGDVVLDAPGVELADLESPPNEFPV